MAPRKNSTRFLDERGLDGARGQCLLDVSLAQQKSCCPA
jgi:hypothetical protein